MDRMYSPEASRERANERRVRALADEAERLQAKFTPPNNIWRALSNHGIQGTERATLFQKIMRLLRGKKASHTRQEASSRPDRVPLSQRQDLLNDAAAHERSMPPDTHRDLEDDEDTLSPGTHGTRD